MLRNGDDERQTPRPIKEEMESSAHLSFFVSGARRVGATRCYWRAGVRRMTRAKECRMHCSTNDWQYGYEIKSPVALLKGEGRQSFQFGTGALSML